MLRDRSLTNAIVNIIDTNIMSLEGAGTKGQC